MVIYAYLIFAAVLVLTIILLINRKVITKMDIRVAVMASLTFRWFFSALQMLLIWYKLFE